MAEASENTPTVALAIQQGFSARILLQTELLGTLLSAGARVVVLTSDAPAVRGYLEKRGLGQIPVEPMRLEGYAGSSAGRVSFLFRQFRSFAAADRTVDGILGMQWKDALGRRRPSEIAYLILITIVSRVMRVSAVAMKGMVWLENLLDAPDVHGEFFKKYRPDAVVLTSIGVFDDDRYVMREAKAHGARVVSYVLSWDNTTVRGLGTNLSDRVIVWSDVMKEELVRLHRIPPEKIFVDGVPHYDSYGGNGSGLMGKNELGNLFGLDPSKRILFVATKSPNTFLYNADVAGFLCDAIEDGRLPGDCHVVARLHPIYMRRKGGQKMFQKELEEWDELMARHGGERLSVDFPEIIPGDLNYFMPDSEIEKLASLLRHSAVVVNMFSTLNLEASIFDVPSVNVSFEYGHKRPPGKKIARFNIAYDEIQTHNSRVVLSGGTSVAHSSEELLAQVKAYLDEPSLHAAGRKKIVENECGRNLGSAGRAVGRRILETIGN